MKFNVQPSMLKTAFLAVKAVVPAKPLMPVLENIFLQPSDDGSYVTLTATDTENTITVKMDVEEAEAMQPFLIPANYLASYISDAMGEWMVTVETDRDEVIISDLLGDFRFIGNADVREYPKTPAVADGNVFDVDAAAFIENVKVAMSFTSNDNMRPILCGVCLDFKPDGLHFAATDSKMLFTDVLRDVKAEQQAVVIANKKVLSAMTANCIPSGTVQIAFDNRNVVFRQQGIEIMGLQIDGRFPRYESVIPKNNDKIAEVDRNQLMAAVKRVSIGANKTTQRVKLSFNGSASLVLESSDIDHSLNATVKIGTEQQQNVPSGFEIALRSTLLRDILSGFRKDVSKVVLLMQDPRRALLIKSDKDSDRIALLMPMQKD